MLSSNKTMSTRRLHRHEMKNVVRILLASPFPYASQKDLEACSKLIKKEIKALPRRLRGSLISAYSTSTGLCSNLHSGLNRHLINDIWSWVRHEIDRGIGKFLYPIIMSGALSTPQEMKIRKLEPVLEMFRQDFRLEKSAPPGREPILCGKKWQFQVHPCAACMLARVGSDEGVLYALYVGMVGRFSRETLFRGNVPAGELSVHHLDSVRSKRVRFVRSWIKAHLDGETLLREAGEMGLFLKKLYNHLTMSSAHNSSTNRAAHHSSKLSPSQVNPFGDHAALPPQEYASQRGYPKSAITIEVQNPYMSKNWSPRNNDSKIGPIPRPLDIDPRSPVEALGFDLKKLKLRHSEKLNRIPDLMQDNDSDDCSTIYPDDSISMAAFRHTEKQPPCPCSPVPDNAQVHPPNPPNLKVPQKIELRADSVHHKVPSIAPSFKPESTILSYDRGDTPVSVSAPRPYDPMATPEEIFDKYKALLASSPKDGNATALYGLPTPLCESMYFGFKDGGFSDPFSDADIEGGEDEEVVLDGDVGNEG